MEKYLLYPLKKYLLSSFENFSLNYKNKIIGRDVKKGPIGKEWSSGMEWIKHHRFDCALVRATFMPNNFLVKICNCETTSLGMVRVNQILFKTILKKC